MKNPIFVSVVIPTYHDWKRLQLCIDALSKQSYPSSLFEVIIVNNDLDDEETIFLPDNFKIITEKRPGSYAARNAALIIAKGEIVAFTDSDCIPDKDWIELAVMRLVSGANRVAGKVEFIFKSKNLTPTEVYEKVFGFDQETNYKMGVSVTANMITWRKNFDIVGYFNDSLMSGGDIEWGKRANDLGIKIQYAPEVFVKHPARDNLASILKKRRRVAGGAIKINSKENTVFMLLIRGYLPPFRQLIKPFYRSDINLVQKILAMSLVYYFKVYSTTYKLFLKFGFYRPER